MKYQDATEAEEASKKVKVIDADFDEAVLGAGASASVASSSGQGAV